MERCAFWILGAALLAACAPPPGGVPTTGGSTSRDFGTGQTNQGDQASASVNLLRNGNRNMVLTRPGATCTAAFTDPAEPNGSELAQLRCTDGNNGTVTLVYGSDSTPERAVFASNSTGTVISGNIRF